MMLDLTPLNKAITQLERGLAESYAHPEAELMRDGVIQRFEFTYDLCHKMLRRYLQTSDPSLDAIAEMSFAELIRTGSQRGLLLHGWDIWRGYRECRNITSHTYDPAKAEQVFAAIPAFLEDACTLRDKLTERGSA